MHSNTYTKICKVFFGKPTKEFIEKRNEKLHKYWGKFYRADAEFPETHQCEVDVNQREYPGYFADTFWDDVGIVDYKQYAKDGVKLSEFCQTQIKVGLVTHICVWRWFNNNIHEELFEGKSIGYELLGLVDANEALKVLDEKTNRFPYEYFSLLLGENSV